MNGAETLAGAGRVALHATERVLVLAPTAADGQFTRSLLEHAGLGCVVCRHMAQLTACLADGAGAVVVTDQVVGDRTGHELAAAIASQPSWSDVPVLMLSGARTDSSVGAWAQASLGNVTILERPVRLTTLVSALRSAVRGRRRQYQLRDQLVDLAGASASLRHQGERLRMLWDAASIMLAADDLDGMVHAIFARIGGHLELDVCLRFEVDELGEPQLRTWDGISDDEAAALASVATDLAACRADASAAGPKITSRIDVSTDPGLEPLRRLGLRVYACSALVVADRVLGTLSFGSRRRDRFSADDLEFLRTIRDYVTLAYERLRLIRELKDTHRRKDEFLATLAHELRNPLAPIGNAAGILRLVARDPAGVETARRMIERQLAQLVRLIDDLLDVSRITRGKLDLRREVVELAPIVQQAVELARPLVEAAHHRLTVTVPPSPVFLHADPVRLVQVLSNLLNNAAKYMERGGAISLDAAVEDAEAVITVRDAGIGIPAHALPAIFEMFMQVDGSADKARGGLGIGLTLVKRLTEMHGGSVEARSEGPGRGSEFTVRLPVAQAPGVAVPGREADGEVGRTSAGRRVLVADDNPDVASSMGTMLRLMGNDVRTAGDGLEAVEAAREFGPDLVLLDVGMPRLNGYDAARRIRAAPWGKTMRLIAVTGWGQEQDKQCAAAAGFDRHFTKPLRMQDLSALLADLDTPVAPDRVSD